MTPGALKGCRSFCDLTGHVRIKNTRIPPFKGSTKHLGKDDSVDDLNGLNPSSNPLPNPLGLVSLRRSQLCTVPRIPFFLQLRYRALLVPS